MNFPVFLRLRRQFFAALVFFCFQAIPAQAAAVSAPLPPVPLRGAVPLPLAGANLEHLVAPGEYLYAIARLYRVSYAAIARANRIENPDLIFAGRKLLIPLEAIVPAEPETDEGFELLLNIPECRLYLFLDGKLLKIYPAAVGLPTWRTPVGSFTVTTLLKDPAWHVPPGISRERELPPGTVIPPGPDNPLGRWWVGTSIRHTGLHGTNVPMSVGFPVSRGCVRLYPEDIEEVSALLRPGDPGRFIYEPVKAAREGDILLLEVHPDFYGLSPDLEAQAWRKLEKTLPEGVDPAEAIDRRAMEKALSAKLGVPVVVSR